MQSNRIGGPALGGLLVLGSTLAAAAPPAQETAPDPQQIVSRMCSYLKSLDRFSFTAEITDDRVYSGGKKLQYGFTTETFVQRPDKLRINAQGDLIDKQVFINGKTLTLYDPADQVYATAEVPAELEDALAHVDQKLHFRVPLGDLASPRLCEHLARGQRHALFVGPSKVRGVAADHLAFDRGDIQFQVWVATGERPLPVKILITQKGLPASPQWTALLSDWQTAHRQPSDLFSFKAPAGVHQIKLAPPPPSAATAAETGAKP